MTAKKLVTHIPLIRLAKSEAEDDEKLLGDDPDTPGNQFYFWHITTAPGVYTNATPESLMQECIAKEMAEGGRVYDVTRDRALGKSAPESVISASFKVELKTDNVHAFFMHYFFFVNDKGWPKQEDSRVITFYDE